MKLLVKAIRTYQKENQNIIVLAPRRKHRVKNKNRVKNKKKQSKKQKQPRN